MFLIQRIYKCSFKLYTTKTDTAKFQQLLDQGCGGNNRRRQATAGA